MPDVSSGDLEKLAEQWEHWQAGTLYRNRPAWLRRILLGRFYYRLGSADTRALFLRLEERREERNAPSHRAVRTLDAAA